MRMTPSKLGRGRIMVYLDRRWGVSVAGMAKTFDINPKSLYSYLCSMKRDGLVYRWTRGMWALTETGKAALEDLRKRGK